MAGKQAEVGFRFVSHPNEEDWEEYALGRITGQRLQRLEEHLLACDDCQSTLEDVDTLIHAMRSLAPKSTNEPISSAVRSAPNWIPFPIRPAILTLCLGVLLVLTIGVGAVRSPHPFGARPEELPTTSVALASFRGESSATAPEKRPLALEISPSDFSSAAAYTLVVVNSLGDTAWKGSPEIEPGQKLVGRIPNGLGKGAYWVRLYGSDATLIREFGLRVD